MSVLLTATSPSRKKCHAFAFAFLDFLIRRKKKRWTDGRPDGRSLNLHFLTCLTATVCAAREFHPCGARAVFFFLFLPFRCVLHPPPPPLIIFDSCQTVLFFILHRRRRRKKNAVGLFTSITNIYIKILGKYQRE